MRKESDLVAFYWRTWPILAAVLIAFYVLWVLFTPESFGSGFFPAVLVFAFRIAATYAAVKSLPRILSEGQRKAWRYFSVGLWIWTLSDSIYIIAWGLRGEPWSMPSLSDLFHLAGYLAMLTGCATYPLVQPERFGRIREALEVSILGISVLSLSWLIYLSPSISTRTYQINTLFWLALSPVFDLILTVLGLRLLLLRTQRHERLAFGLFSSSYAVMFVSDMSSSYGLVLNRASIPSLTQAGWMISAALLGLAFQRMTVPKKQGEAVAKSTVSTASRWIWRIEPLVPVAFTYTVVGYVFFDWWFSEVLDWVALAGAGILIILLFARQGVIAGQREMSQFAALVNSTADMAFILDERGRIRMANPALHEALGVAEDEIQELTFERVIDLGSAMEFSELIEVARERGWSGEGMLTQPGGKGSPVLLSINPVAHSQRG
jgi:PAS domain S-box-containing protein